MPGGWNGYTNYPSATTHFAFRGTTTKIAVDGGSPNNGTSGDAVGGLNIAPKALAGSQSIYSTLIHAAASGGDVVAGTYGWLFTSGNPYGGQYGNKWAGVNVTMNTLQTYTYNGGADNNITFVNNRWYTMNYKNVGYTGTNNGAIFMVTSAPPVAISNVTQTPAAGSVTPTNSVALTITLAGPKSAEENVFIRYSTNSFSTSTILQATLVSGNDFTATIPAQVDGTIVSYYAFTSTVALGTLTGNYDAYTLKFKNAGGTVPYTYTSAASAPVNITFRVDMANSPVGGGGVNLAGSFNGFSTSANPMSQVGSTSVYETTVSVPANGTIQYKFVNGTNFEGNISVPCGNGSNRTFTTGTSDATIPTTCFSVCGACPPQHLVTFTVDMNNEAGVTGVSLNGTFNGYNAAINPMTQIGTTGVWSTTVSLVEGNSYNYKFVKNGTSYENNIPSGTCNPGGAGGNDRRWTVGTANESIPSTCYGSCGACTPLSFVTFRVDMKYQTVIAPLQLRGNFNGFSAGDNLTQVGSTTVWQITKQIAEGTNIQYKFYNGNYEASGGGCFSFGGNRGLTVPSANVVLAAECYGLCGACPASVPVTFNVNMAGQTVTTGVVVSGNFNGFNTSATQLTQIGSTQVWTGTAQVPVNSTIDYKFVNGVGTNNYEANFVGPCKVSYNSNRGLNVGSAPINVPTVCWNRCIDCGATNVWTGTANTDYTNGANWTAGVLVTGATADVQINGGANALNVPAATSVIFRNVTYNNNPTINLGSGSTLTAGGTYTGSGSVNGGTVALTSGAPVTIAGTQNVNSLSVSTPTTITGSVGVSDLVTLTSGSSSITVNPGASLRLKSSAAGTAKIGPVPVGGSITGNVTLERYVGGNAGWYFVGVPFSGTTLADLSEAGVRVSPKNNANIYFCDETDTASLRIPAGTGPYIERFGWKVPSSLANLVNAGGKPTGYRLYLNPFFMGGSRKLVTTGVPFVGDKTVPVTFTPVGGFAGGGWNFISNPYACEIDWNAVATENAAAPIGNVYSVWNGTNANYASYSGLGVSVNGGSRYIASSQGFFVRSIAAGSVVFKESHKNTANGTTFVRTGDLDNLLNVRITQGTNFDEASVLFYNDGAIGRDRFDADNLGGSAVDVSMVPVAGLELAINIMPRFDTRFEIPLNLTVSTTGVANATFTGMGSFTAGARIYLRDNFLGTLTDITTTSSVDFTVTSNPASSGSSRFALVFVPNAVTSANEVVNTTATMNVWPNPSNGTSKLSVGLTHFSGSTAKLMLVDMTGKVILTQTINTTGGEVSIKDLQAGVYMLKAQGANQTLQQRVVIQ